jgi:glycosyltransferase involved in cell wall biosynthesis
MRRRVLFLTVMPSPYQRELFNALHSDGRMEIHVLYYSDASDRHWSVAGLYPFEKVLPSKTIRWLDPPAYFNTGVIKVLRDDPSDLFVLSDYSMPTTQIAMRYLSWRRKPWVFWGERPGFRSGAVAGFIRHGLQRPIRGGAVAIAAMGSLAVAAYQQLFPEIPVFNIPYFCDLAPFRAAKQREKQKSPAVSILFSGQLIERKGVDVLIQAFARIARLVPALELHLLGSGPALDSLCKLIPPDLSSRIHFLGFKQPSAMPEVFATTDIFVLPSRHDGWGVVVNEALGAGLPIVVSDHVGARDLVEDGRNGLITRAGDVEALADALLQLGQSQELRRSFATASAERATQWDLDEGVRRWIELYDQMVAQGRKSSGSGSNGG